MKATIVLASFLFVGATAAPYAIAGETDSKAAAMTPKQQINAVEGNCTALAEAQAAMPAKPPLFERLGGGSGIRRLVNELLRLHYRNDLLYEVLQNYSPGELSDRLTPYLVQFTGGPSVYKGAPLPESHRRLGLTDDHFAAGGKDLLEAMNNLGYAQGEIDDLVCFIFARHDEVIFD